jgi:hypothetical protein
MQWRHLHASLHPIMPSPRKWITDILLGHYLAYVVVSYAIPSLPESVEVALLYFAIPSCYHPLILFLSYSIFHS